MTHVGVVRARSSRNATAPELLSGEATAREFVRAFNEHDVDAFAETLAPDVVLHSMKGDRLGVAAAREWATRTPGGVQQTVVVTSVEEIGEKALVRIRRDWRWAEDGSLAGSDDMAWFFHFKDGLIDAWRPFEDSAEAFAAFNA
jgi:ketosteroid isomerase-like protein